MGEKVVERRLQQSHGSFLLTIPQDMVKRAKLHRGQGVRLTVRNGEIVITPTSTVTDGGAPDPAGQDEYKRAVTEMIAKGRSEKSKERGGAAPGRSKLERLRLK